MNSLSFFVAGRPQQRGSKRAFANPKGGRPLIVDDNKKSRPWMEAVTNAAAAAMNGGELWQGPVLITVCFQFKRPKGHHHQRKSGSVLRADAPEWHTSPPDADKLMRAVGDALSGIVYRDDSQLASVMVTKGYTSSSEGAQIIMRQL